jgi:hypothetical protein
MFQMRWAIVPACLTFGPLFFVMGIAGDAQLCLLGAVMTVMGLGILFHGIATRQLPAGSPPSREYLSGIVSGIGLGCLLVAGLLHDLSVDWLMYVGIAVFFVGSFLRPHVEVASKASPGNA